MNKHIRLAIRTGVRAEALTETLKDLQYHQAHGHLTTADLLFNANAATNRACGLEGNLTSDPATLHEKHAHFAIRNLRRIIRGTVCQACGFEYPAQAREYAVQACKVAVHLGNRDAAREAHELLWAASAGELTEDEWKVFEACETI